MSNKDFRVQEIWRDGVSEFHLNHYFAYFDGTDLPHVKLSDDMIFPVAPVIAKHRLGKSIHETRDIRPDDVTLHLQSIFEHIFNPNRAAIVRRGGTQFHKNPLMKFTATMLGAQAPHDDWVYLKEDTKTPHVYATTLDHLNSSLRDAMFDNATLFMCALGVITSSLPAWIVPIVGSELLKPDDISKHFLAGRRAWKCGFDPERGLHYIETAALERYSDPAYAHMHSMIRPMLDATWHDFILNFCRMIGVQAIDVGPLHGYTPKHVPEAPDVIKYVPTGIVTSGPVYQRKDEFEADTKAKARKAYDDLKWFQFCVSRMPSLSMDRMPGM